MYVLSSCYTPLILNPLHSYAEYLALERASGERHEFLRGAVWAMAGGTPEHSRLAMAVGAVLRSALGRKPCVVYGSDARLRVPSTDRSTDADAFVVCGAEQHADDDANSIINPTLIVEVLSPSTERSDRGEKFAHYQRVSTLQAYVLVNQDSRRIEVFERQGPNWLLRIFAEGERVALTSIGIDIAVDDVYFDPRSA